MAVAGLKGGTSKTTTAVMLAVSASARGIPTLVVDCDPQASARAWASRAREAGTPLPFSVALNEARQGFGAAVDYLTGVHGAVLTLCDLPSRDGPSQRMTRAAVAEVDLVVAPTGTPPLDVEQLVALIGWVDEFEAELLIVPSRIRRNTRAWAQLSDEILQERLRSSPPVPLRESIAHLFGTCPAPDPFYDAVLDSLLAVRLKRPERKIRN